MNFHYFKTLLLFSSVVGLLLLFGCTPQNENQAKEIKDTAWAILPFVKVDSLNPILAAGERDDGTYIMTYTAYDGKVARLCVASSTNLVKWIKHGLVLQGKYVDSWSKSEAIVAKQVGEKIVAKKINGKYWMYFGDTDLFLATSDDLIHWQPVVDENQKFKSILQPRKNYFDSRLVESGPYALLTDKGIVLIYNGMNLDVGGDSTIAKGAYCAGQALFDKNDPSKLIDRLEKNFLRPDKPYEISGQINQVCFVEGLVPFHGKWFLYFGTADSKIAVAVSPILPPSS
ncbi:MAG: glycoside hydrolase family 130 protein [Flammeovirgaceae bacterium]|jgi:predicted GH43/DUF377 family glycosyl hydrolase|nr:glycoside hydrolase family 130 protein [Flammeovirgaceae bacterium]